jgi:hypothetical protein
MPTLTTFLLSAAFYSLRHAQQQGDLTASKHLATQLFRLQQQAGQYAVPNDFGAR